MSLGLIINKMGLMLGFQQVFDLFFCLRQSKLLIKTRRFLQWE